MNTMNMLLAVMLSVLTLTTTSSCELYGDAPQPCHTCGQNNGNGGFGNAGGLNEGEYLVFSPDPKPVGVNVYFDDGINYNGMVRVTSPFYQSVNIGGTSFVGIFTSDMDKYAADMQSHPYWYSQFVVIPELDNGVPRVVTVYDQPATNPNRQPIFIQAVIINEMYASQ